MPSLTDIQVPPEWERLNPEELSGTIVVIGRSDSGKSTLVRWLMARLCQHQERVAWLDADIGQSTLGVPTTMNLAVLARPCHLNARLPSAEATFFVGSTSPRGHMLPTLVGAYRLRQRALERGAAAIVVDTTGLVDAHQGGGALKRWKIALLEATTVIALQRYGELAHILAPLACEPRVKVHLLPVAGAVVPRSRDWRVRRRQEQFRRYFAGALPVTIDWGRLAVYGREQAGPGRLVALQDAGGFVLALGVITQVTVRQMTVLTPGREMEQVVSIQVGDLRLDPKTGRELG